MGLRKAVKLHSSLPHAARSGKTTRTRLHQAGAEHAVEFRGDDGVARLQRVQQGSALGTISYRLGSESPALPCDLLPNARGAY
jgi:hypothetical protein